MPPRQSGCQLSTRPYVRVSSTTTALLLLLVLLSPITTLTSNVSSDPGWVDNGDYTKSVLWNFTDPLGYSLSNTTVSGGLGTLELVNETVVENTTAQYLLGTRTNLDLMKVQDAIAIDNTSLPVQTLVLQPGPEGMDNYMDEWFPYWSPPEGSDLEFDCNYDPGVTYNKRSSIIMKFDLSLVPAGATIRDATLLLYEKGGKVPSVSYTIHAVMKTWAEVGVSWGTRDSTLNWEALGGDYSPEVLSSGIVDGLNGWKSFDLSRLVDLWTRGTIPNHGFVIVAVPQNLDGLKVFSDCETTNRPEQRPILMVNYTLGGVSGTYESSPLGPETNATFTLASWTEGAISRATDEFDTGGISSMWEWTNDPSLAGGSVNFDRTGWLNVTGSQPTELTNASVGCNYLHQAADGNFQAETSLESFFSIDSMGAGLLIKSDDLAWLAIYLGGVQGNGLVVAKAFNGSAAGTLGSMPWTATTAHLRIDRTDGTYQLLASADGTNWSTVASYVPVYDLKQRLAVGLCVFSGGATSSPVVEFDFFRLQPVEQDPTLEMRIRTGNSTNLADPSWQPWGAPIGPSTGIVLNSTGKYVQYQVTLSTTWEWLTPLFSGIACHEEHHLPDGVITTTNVWPNDLGTWESMTVTQTTTDGDIQYYYSTNEGASWQLLGSGNSFSMGVTEPSMMLRMVLQTHDTIVTPMIDAIELLYSVSIASFQVTSPATVVAGDLFPITIEARDPSNNVAAGWNGTVTLHAMNAAGTSSASDEVYVTAVVVPLGGVLTLWNQRYDFAETIRISATAGTVRGTSAPIVVQPGPATTMTLEPGNTTMFDHTSQAFTATAYDALGNVITGAAYSWTADTALGVLNTTGGRAVLLTVGEYYTGGYLNVTCSGVSVSRWIDVLPTRFAPSFTSPLPNQTKLEDSGEWTLDISDFVSDVEDPHSKLRWYTTHESIVGVRGENRTGNLVITFTTLPDVAGSTDLNVVVVDSDGMKATETLHVVIEPINDPPTIDLIDPLTVQHDVPYLYNFEQYVHDTDNQLSELSLSVDGQNAPYSVIDDMYITFRFPESMLGTTQTVIITVKDSYNASGATAVLVRVNDDAVPQQIRMLPTIALDQGTTLVDCAFLPEYFHDPDDNDLIYDWECEHSTIVIKLDGHINVTAPIDWYGVEYAIIKAIDPHGARVEGIMEIVVQQVNHPPVIDQVPDLKVRYDQRYEFDVWPYVHDLDESPEELTFTTNDLHCTFTGTLLNVLYPVGMNNTVNPVTITVTDGAYSSSCTINITVSADYPPEPFPDRLLPDHTFQEDNPTRYPMEHGLEYYFWDQEDGQTLSFAAQSLNSNVTATASKNETDVWKLELNATQDYYGTSKLVIRAIDSFGAILEQTITLEVTPVPDAPVLNLPSTFSVIEGQQVVLNLAEYITDPDSSINDGDFNFTVQIIGANGDEADYLEGISILPGMLLFEYPAGFLKDHEARFTVEVAATDQTEKVGRDEIVIALSKVSNKGEDPLMLSAAILATIGGISGMGAVAYVRRKKPFVVMDMMLVHNDGFLIGRYASHAHVDGEIDHDIQSGMLTAVLNFVEDSMYTNRESLKTFGFGDYQVLVQRGTKSFAAVVYKGDQPTDIEKTVAEFLATFERVYKKKLMSWTGDIETDFAGVELLIQSFVKEHSKMSGNKAGRIRAFHMQKHEKPAK